MMKLDIDCGKGSRDIEVALITSRRIRVLCYEISDSELETTSGAYDDEKDLIYLFVGDECELEETLSHEHLHRALKRLGEREACIKLDELAFGLYNTDCDNARGCNINVDGLYCISCKIVWKR